MLNCLIPLNYESLLEIDTNYGGTASWAVLAKGVKNIAPALNESLDQTSYFDGDGFAETTVLGAQYILSVTADRIKGDTAQDFVLGLQLELGCSRVTQARMTSFDGEVKSGIVTIANITPPGGDAVAKGEFSFELHFKAKPTKVPAISAPELSAVIDAGSVAGSTKFTATATEGNSLGYLLTAGVPTTPNVGAYVSVLAYTSADDIPAAEEQSLNMFELDANGRVVKFATDVLASDDFPS